MIEHRGRVVPMLVASCALLLAQGCSGAFWGNLVVLGITLGIFFGTLALGRTSSTSSSAESSTSSRS